MFQKTVSITFFTDCYTQKCFFTGGSVGFDTMDSFFFVFFFCIAIMISSTTIIIQIQAVRTSLLFLGLSPWKHKETDTNHKSLCKPYDTDPPTHTAHLVVSKISAHLCRSRLKPICFYQIRKTQPLPYNLNSPSFQNPQIHKAIYSGYDVNQQLNSLQRPSSPISCLGFNYDSGWWTYPFRTALRVNHLTMAPELRDTELFKALTNLIIKYD